MSETHAMEVVDSIANLAEDTIDLWTRHLTRHDHTEEVVGGILHDLYISHVMSGSAADGHCELSQTS